MEDNKFYLNLEQLKEISAALQQRIAKGLSVDDTDLDVKNEIACLPTYIQPEPKFPDGSAMVLDLGGTNYRVAKVTFKNGKCEISPNGGSKYNLEKMKEDKYSKEDLMKDMTGPILALDRDTEMPIGYCFSYPATSLHNGDSILNKWTKGVNIPDMVGKSVGAPLVEYLNNNLNGSPHFTQAKVINDTVASLFAGLTTPGYDAYIGLIVGTGTNMAAMFPAKKIAKIAGKEGVNFDADIPVNLESGNFFPPHLTPIDTFVDALSDSKGCQRFEKAISGMYLGEILKAMNPFDKFQVGFNAKSLSDIMNYPDMYKEKYVVLAHQIYERSANLVAASLAGLILQLNDMHDKPLNKIYITADGSLFWSKIDNGKDYHVLVTEKLYELLKAFGLPNIEFTFNATENVNLIGSAIAALS